MTRISPAPWRSPGPTTAKPKRSKGRVDGTLVWPPRGDKGFGYDPIFVPAGFDATFGEIDPEQKHSISHRGRCVPETSRRAWLAAGWRAPQGPSVARHAVLVARGE